MSEVVAFEAAAAPAAWIARMMITTNACRTPQRVVKKSMLQMVARLGNEPGLLDVFFATVAWFPCHAGDTRASLTSTAQVFSHLTFGNCQAL
jgi:hypothetical protein